MGSREGGVGGMVVPPRALHRKRDEAVGRLFFDEFREDKVDVVDECPN